MSLNLLKDCLHLISYFLGRCIETPVIFLRNRDRPGDSMLTHTQKVVSGAGTDAHCAPGSVILGSFPPSGPASLTRTVTPSSSASRCATVNPCPDEVSEQILHE